MAKPNWLKVSPSSGSGNASVAVSSTAEHTGRVARTGILTFKAANVSEIQRTVNQAGKPAYVDIDGTATADKGGKRVTISGESNSASLTFSLGVGTLIIEPPITYTANSVVTANGMPIAGDPGAKASYTFSIVIDVPANESIESKTRQIIVEDENGNRDFCELTSAAGDAYVTIPDGDIELGWVGTPVAIEVKSNTTWTIE